MGTSSSRVGAAAGHGHLRGGRAGRRLPDGPGVLAAADAGRAAGVRAADARAPGRRRGVLRARGRVRDVPGRPTELCPPGTFVYVPRGTAHTFRSSPPGRARSSTSSRGRRWSASSRISRRPSRPAPPRRTWSTRSPRGTGWTSWGPSRRRTCASTSPDATPAPSRRSTISRAEGRRDGDEVGTATWPGAVSGACSS